MAQCFDRSIKSRQLIFCLLIPALLWSLSVRAQISGKDFSAIDHFAQRAPGKLSQDLPALTAYLTENATDELEKARAIYVWITTHIVYDHQAALRNKRTNHSVQDVLDRRMAICVGYAQLFREMCRLADIPAFVVNGYGRQLNDSEPLPDEPNHSWNAALLDGKWYLFDPTWGHGTTNGNASVYTLENDPFFAARPATFIRTHLPGNPMWQLLAHPLPAAAFIEADSSLTRHLSQPDNSYAYSDSLQVFLQLSADRQRLYEAAQTYNSHPSESNRSQYAHSLIDLAGILADTVEQLQSGTDVERLRQLNAEVIGLCRQAHQLTVLYPWQQELFTNALINQAVLLYNRQTELELSAEEAAKEALLLLNDALTIIETSKDSPFNRMARQQCSQYIQVLE
jgi:hypothetical protein